MKKDWKTPQLIVFCKGKPEEAVLSVCKTHGDASAPGTSRDTCKPPTDASTVVGGKKIVGVACPQACKGVTGS